MISQTIPYGISDVFFYLQITSTSRIYFISLLQQLTRQIEDHASVINTAERMGIQTNALRVGGLLQNLGAMLLELGRTTMTLRIGQTPVCLVNSLYVE